MTARKGRNRQRVIYAGIATQYALLLSPIRGLKFFHSLVTSFGTVLLNTRSGTLAVASLEKDTFVAHAEANHTTSKTAPSPTKDSPAVIDVVGSEGLQKK